MRTVDLPGSLVLVPSKGLEAQATRMARDHPGLPLNPVQLLNDLNSRPDGVPATLSEPFKAGGDWSLLLYGQTYVARLFASKRGDAYTVASVNPLRISDHQRLVQGHLFLRPARWVMEPELRRIPEGSNAHWPRIGGEWKKLTRDQAAERGAPRLSVEQAAYLDTLERLIDADERITTEASAQLYPYRKVTSTGERRYRANAVYEFQIAGGRLPQEGTFVRVCGEQEFKGQVMRVEEDRATVRFHDAIDWDRIKGQGELEETPNRTVYAKQREAVAMLRDRRAGNTGLLPAIVDHQVRPIGPSSAEPTQELDEDQLQAFRKAVEVPDLLLVLGPPGTGKTRTISQIVGACAHRGERVLVTSHTHRAVDNVLARLPRDLVAIRVGIEGSVTAEGRPYLLERQALELSERARDAASRALPAYEDLGHATRWAETLEARALELDAAVEAERRAGIELHAVRRASGGPLQARLDGLGAELAAYERESGGIQSLVARLSVLRDRAAAREGRPVLGPLFAMLRRRRDGRIETARQRARGLTEAMGRVRVAVDQAERELDARTRDVPAVRAARSALEQRTRQREECRTRVQEAARAAVAAVRSLATPPGEEDIEELRGWLRTWLPVLSTRRRLLAGWREKISTETDQLSSELIRYADVVAATCIGAASRPELSGIDFDIAIVDEAGQIGMNNALVPLVRAKRAVLVGDHKQLPPFLDSDVEAWGASVDDPRIRDLLAKSALELLVDRMPAGHVVPLTWQRRMPAAIADFISTTFYDGRLRTAVEREQVDPIFRCPMTLVDTANLRFTERREQQRGREAWERPGYVNVAEAELLADLAAFYHRSGMDWAVIVPYKAQMTDIRARVVRLIGGAEEVGLNVGTVDSFQGGERDVILYGFTRSNNAGRVGFLKELRRANVAFTRARHRLVLVGDLSTLLNARDAGFRDLASSLHDHLRTRGEIRDYGDVGDRLRDLT
jgi:hypothetical protein